MLNTIAKSLSHAKFKFIAESPTIAIGAGVVGLTAAIVLSGRAALKAKPVIDEYKENKQAIDPELSEKEQQSVLINHAVTAGTKLAKIYAPTVAIAGLSIAGIVYGRNAFQHRITSLSAAYQVLSSTLESYRKRVEAEVGEEKESELYFDNAKTQALKDKERIEGKDAAVIRKGAVKHSVYARFFDETSPNWNSRPGENRLFLQNAQQYFNDILNRRGYVFLNEVFDFLGLENTPEGQYIGWYRRKPSEDIKRVDFGLFDLDSEAKRRFINDDEPTILLDFNVDGYILDKM